MTEIIDENVQGTVSGVGYKYRLTKTNNKDYQAELIVLSYNKDRIINIEGDSMNLGKDNPKETFENVLSNAIDEVNKKLKNTRGRDNKHKIKLYQEDDDIKVKINSKREKTVHHKSFSFGVKLTTNEARKRYEIKISLRKCPKNYEKYEARKLEFKETIPIKEIRLSKTPPFIKRESNIEKAHKTYEEIDKKIISKINSYTSQYKE